MSLLDSLDRLRRKPKASRDAFAFWIAFGVSACIVLIWLTSLPARMHVISGVLHPSNERASTTVEVPPDQRALPVPVVAADLPPSPARWAFLTKLQASAAEGWQQVVSVVRRTPPANEVDEHDLLPTPVWQPHVSQPPSGTEQPVLIATSSAATSTATGTENVLQ